MSHPSSRTHNAAVKDAADDVSGQDTSSILNYRQQYGSGLVNTKIADRESEVGILVKKKNTSVLS
jgi:hypothetical protein